MLQGIFAFQISLNLALYSENLKHSLHMEWNLSSMHRLLAYRNFPNKRPGRLLTQHPRQGGAYLGQMTFLLYKNAKIAQKWGRLFGRGRLFGKIRYVF